MKITPHDGLTRYMVQSDVNPDNEYLVDLSSYGGIGKCSCSHHTYRMAPELERPGAIKEGLKDPDRWRCKHIIACREMLGKDMVDTLTKRDNQQTKALKALMNQPKKIGYKA